MSVNYHAYQSRGYLFETHEALCQQWRERFTGYNPERISRILNLKNDEHHLYLSYFQTPYRLRLADGILEKYEDNSWNDTLYFNESMSIYHLLYHTCEIPRTSGIWVPNSALNAAASHRGNMPDPLLIPFARRFTDKTELLIKACEQLGGTKTEKGDVGYEFFAFPQIPLRLIFWEADEDFPAQVQVLFDQYVTDYVHFETTGCILSDLLEKLELSVQHTG